MVLRGAGSVKAWDSLRQDDGSYSYPLPNLCADVGRLSIVNVYKHLGGQIQSNLSNMHYVRSRSNAAATAYIPLASKVFSSRT